MAIIKIKNQAIDLDAAEIPNLPASKITSGTFADARIADLAATKLTGTIATARLGSGTASNTTFLRGDQSYQTLSEFNDDKLVNDISTLALHQATNNNSAKYNLTNSNVDVYQDSSAIANLTNVERNTAGEYISSNVNNPESGGTSTAIQSVSGYGWQGTTFASDSYGIYYNTTSYNHSGYTSASTPLTGNYKMTWTSATSNTSNQATSSNNGIQFGIGMGSVSFNQGNSIWNANNSSLFYVMHNGVKSSGNQTVYYTRQQTNQGSDSIAFDTNYYLQLVRDASAGTLKLYGHASNSDPYTQANSLLHTYSGYSGSQADDIIFGTGHPNSTAINSGTRIMTNSSIKTGITAFAGGTSTNATGNYQSTAQTANASVNKISAVVTYTNASGTATLNTDIILQVSADNGSNYTNATLTPAGSFSSGVLQAVTNDISVTAGTQLKYKIFFANQSSGSKITRINGVSLSY